MKKDNFFKQSQKLNKKIQKLKSYRLPFGILYFKRTDRKGRIYFCKIDCMDEFKYQACKKEEIEQYKLSAYDLPNEQDYNKFQNTKHKLSWYKNKLTHLYFDNLKEKNRQNLDVINKKLYEQRKELYNKYMSSKEWIKKRQQCLDFYNNICQDCYEIAESVHHLHYDTLGDEDISKDIIPLCQNCHRKRHGLPIENIKELFEEM